MASSGGGKVTFLKNKIKCIVVICSMKTSTFSVVSLHLHPFPFNQYYSETLKESYPTFLWEMRSLNMFPVFSTWERPAGKTLRSSGASVEKTQKLSAASEWE